MLTSNLEHAYPPLSDFEYLNGTYWDEVKISLQVQINSDISPSVGCIVATHNKVAVFFTHLRVIRKQNNGLYSEMWIQFKFSR
jgi:hypothetical protein